MQAKTYLVVGSGGREHALAWKLASEENSTVYVAPGNPGIARDEAIAGCVAIGVDDFDALAQFAESNEVDLTVVGPEAPLCAGLVDDFTARGLRTFGPQRQAARLEGSKSFAKEIMNAAGVPTAAYEYFESLEPALAYVQQVAHPVVIKADGLAGGKGVVISSSADESEATLREYMARGRFGRASERVIVEEFLEGPEMSFMVVTDGESVVPLSTSRDHKRLGDGDTGPNTGGMGAITPSPDITPELRTRILEEVVHPVLEELKRREMPYRGFLYAGLMLTADGPRVLEFNCRLGDPETQALLFAMEAPLGPVLLAAAEGNLETHSLATDRAACCVVLASEGYPGDTKTGFPIKGLDTATTPDVKIFCAGTGADADGRLINAGGRVLGVTARGETLETARVSAYRTAAKIAWPGMHYRRDIGKRTD